MWSSVRYACIRMVFTHHRIASAFDYTSGVKMLNGIRLNRLSSKALVMVIGLSAYSQSYLIMMVLLGIPEFRTQVGWQQENLFGAVTWDPVLNYTDAVFGSSQGFYELYKAASASHTFFFFYLFSQLA